MEVALPKAELVFVKDNGQFLGTDSPKYAFKVIHYELGINSRFHDFRDTHATRLIENGADIKAVSQRLGHSTIITTNKPFGKWHEIFNDVTLANAILDRLLHHSHIININGNSYRLKNKLKIDSESSEPIQN